MKIKINKLIIFLELVIMIPFFVVLVFNNVNLLLLSSFVIWGLFVVYSTLKEDYYLLGFFTVFFIFLISAESLSKVGLVKFNEEFSEKVNNHAYVSILISLVSIALGYYIFSIKSSKNKQIKDDSKIFIDKDYIQILRNVALIFFFVSLIFNLIILFEKISTISETNFLVSYKGFVSKYSSIFFIISGFFDISYALYLATMPRKKSFILISIIYVFYSALTLLTYQRMYYFTNFIMIVLYILSRQKFNNKQIKYTNYTLDNENWHSKVLIIVLSLLFFFSIPLMNKLNDLRTQQIYQNNKKDSKLKNEINDYNNQTDKSNTEDSKLKNEVNDYNNQTDKSNTEDSKLKNEVNDYNKQTDKNNTEDSKLKNETNVSDNKQNTQQNKEDNKLNNEKSLENKDKHIVQNEVIDFVGNQGFSINVIKWGKINREYLSDRKFLFGNVTDYFKYGSFSEKFLNKKYEWYGKGNNQEMATLSNRYSHALTYRLFPNMYLSGRGVGSSYIAEAYQDYGYIGIALTSFLIGWILRFLYVDLNIFKLYFGYKVLPIFLFMPRSSFDLFILEILSIKNILYTIIVFTISWIILRLKKLKNKN